MTTLTDALYVAPDMAAVWSGENFVRGILTFEGALARAEARAGVIPAEAAIAISGACVGGAFDTEALLREAADAGSPAIPVIHALTTMVGEPAGWYVHWGATSQDAIDTAHVLQMRVGITLLRATALATGEICARLAETRRGDIMVGRTLLQQATPITFGLKAARWLALLTRQARRLNELRDQIGVVQFGGASGTLAALGDQGPRIMELLAEELGLAAPDLPWHAERDRVAEVAAGLGVLAGAFAKIAGDVILLAQTEVGEVAEAAAEGRGGSSTMPQKRNPTHAVAAVAAARLALGTASALLGATAQEHERAAGAWQMEWAALPDLFRYTSGAALHTRRSLEGLIIDVGRMRERLDQSGGLPLTEALMMALAP
ncbi:MAG TPA: 3-carboxy-cis,cis-muconate cycloisomerase, partial [Ktedonobacterales bacterium]|nr:3-carboxy-cis,cis-muconate cycloisomerase [Ktedonobacterales bacterium]